MSQRRNEYGPWVEVTPDAHGRLHIKVRRPKGCCVFVSIGRGPSGAEEEIVWDICLYPGEALSFRSLLRAGPGRVVMRVLCDVPVDLKIVGVE